MSIRRKIKEEGNNIKNEFKDKFSGYVLGALGVVAGLAWNDFVRSLIDYLFPVGKGGDLLAKLIYAFVITIVVVIVGYYVVKFLGKKDEVH